MEIGSLGFINTIVSNSEKSNSPSEGSSFNSLFGHAILNGLPMKEVTEMPQSLMNGISQPDGFELLAFLQTEDVLDLDGGMKLLDQVLSSANPELMKMIQEFLGINDSELEKMVESLNLFLEIQSTSKEQIEKEIEPLEAIMNFVSQQNISPQEPMMTKEFSQVVKVVKLFELLSQHQNMSNDSRTDLKEWVQRMTEKLDLLLKGSSNNERLDYLQKTFKAVASDLKNGVLSTNENQVQLVSKLEMMNGIPYQLQQMSKPEQLTLMLDKSKPVSAEQLIQQFENILSKSKFTNVGGTQKLFIKLNPEHLGSLRVELIQKDSQLMARILTTTGTAKETLDSQINALKNAFSSQNIQVEKIEISQQSFQQERFLNKENQQHQQQKQEKQPDTAQTSTEDEGKQSFEETLLSIEV
ncbi:flagellar hook-length control protein FliK [Cytobacillus spongiae]|uniref:flagellar hook-length control protein FliK n=1 Tax=Cytobacillus spongiae TaxID=2901381 RepID=UPI001F3FA3B8|nr:flagellar hook-length control protein FliK [Cytobacillus spongiae]UII57413.1 flagellar hook-length control protein FliK [Cytobacillus spongiae]